MRCDGAASAAGASGEFVRKRLQAFLATTIPPCWKAEASRKSGALLRASAVAQRPTLKSVHSSKVFVWLFLSFCVMRERGERITAFSSGALTQSFRKSPLLLLCTSRADGAHLSIQTYICVPLLSAGSRLWP